MSQHPDQDPIDNLEEELRRKAEEVERDQLEREISGNLTPADEEMINLREERLRREAIEEARRERERGGTEKPEDREVIRDKVFEILGNRIRYEDWTKYGLAGFHKDEDKPHTIFIETSDGRVFRFDVTEP